MKEYIGLFFSLFWRLLWCSLPLFTEYASAALSKSTQEDHILNNSNMRIFVSNYSDSMLVAACLFFLFAGTLVGYFYPTPKYGVKPYPKFLKVFISVTFGLLAFLYYLEDNKAITPAVCIYVAGVSFVAPAIAHLIHAAAIKFTGLKLFVSDKDIKRIEKSFDDSEDED